MSNLDDFDRWLNSNSNENLLNNDNKNDNKSNIEDTTKIENTSFFDENNDEYTSEEIFDEPNYANKEFVLEQIRNSKPKFNILKTVGLVMVGAVLGSYFGNYFRNEPINPSNRYVNASQINISPDKSLSVENAVAMKGIPSVVGINTKYVGNDNFFGRVSMGEGLGSGVIVSSDGFILTNSHVIADNPTDIVVVFSDNSTAEGKIVWQDDTLDLGIVKVNKEGLNPIEFANSDEISIGDKAIAIGNPVGLNLQSTLTSGYISGLNRSITMQNGLSMDGLIQTDASINSGNSGGALLNSEGKLIGINTAKAGNTDGIGFAIPSNLAKSIVDAVRENGEFSPVILGIRGMDVSAFKQLYTDLDFEGNEGIIVSEVISGTAAFKSGLQSKDIIVKIGEDKIESMNKLKQVLLKYTPGNTTTITINRDGKEIDLDITFQENQPDL